MYIHIYIYIFICHVNDHPSSGGASMSFPMTRRPSGSSSQSPATQAASMACAARDVGRLKKFKKRLGKQWTSKKNMSKIEIDHLEKAGLAIFR